MRRLRQFPIQGAFILACAALASPATAQTCIEAPLGLHAWWPGDGDTTELEAGLHGVAVNGTGYSQGVVGEAFDFDGFGNGQDDRIDLPPSALNGLTDMTVEMWVRSLGQQGAFMSGAGPTTPGVILDNEILVHHGRGGALTVMQQDQSGTCPSCFHDGPWHHVALSRSGDVSLFYMDGAVVDSRLVPMRAFDVGPGGLLLGQEQDCLGGCFDASQALDGQVDELSIYDRALSDAEVYAIFDAGEAGKCKPPSKSDLLQDIAELEMSNDDMMQDMDDMDFEIGALLGRIDELVMAAGQEPQLCENTCEEPVCAAAPHDGKHGKKMKRKKMKRKKMKRGKHAKNDLCD